MPRTKRQAKILEVISLDNIETQQELMLILQNEGFTVTQATISRDIQELGLVKQSKKGAKSYYVMPVDPKLAKLKTLFHQSVIKITGINNMVVIKTISGAANSACVLIDRLENEDIIGAVAGDDTILVILSSDKVTEDMVKQLEQLAE